MYVHFINVAQGASALLEFPCAAILIDAGAQDAGFHEKLMNYLGAFFERRKDLDSTLDLIREGWTRCIGIVRRSILRIA